MNKKISTGICYALILLVAVILTVISPLLPVITREFELNMVQAGFLFTAKFIGFTVFILLGGILSDKFGKKIVLSINMIVMTIALAAFSFAPNYIMGCIFIFLIGSTCGILESLANALVADINTEKQSYYIILAQVFFGVGALSGPLLCGLMISLDISWRVVYQMLSIITIMITTVFIINKLPRFEKQEVLTMQSFKAVVMDKRFLLLCFCMFLYTGSEVGTWGWMATFMNEGLSFNIIKSSLAVGVFWIAMIAGRIVGAPLTLKYPTRNLLMFFAFGAAIVTVLSGIIKNEIFVWVIIVLLGLFYSSQWPFIVAYGSENYNKYSGTVFALLVGSGGVGVSVIPLLMGTIGQYTSMGIAMITPAIFFIMIGIAFTLIDRIGGRNTN